MSYSKYSAFLQNQERYRLSYVIGLTKEGDETPSIANLGRRRGRCFHALAEGQPRTECIQEYSEPLVERCERMIAVLPPELIPSFILKEESFEIPIGDGKHSINGRLDHIFTVDGHKRVGDFKTTKGTRTKKELSEYFCELDTSSQSHFYLRAAHHLGHPTDLFTYHVILDAKDKKSLPRYVPIDLDPQKNGPASVARTMAGVYAACEEVEFLTKTYGIEKPWPHSNHWPCTGDSFFCGFRGVCGRTIPKGCMPAGFTNRWKEQIQKEDGQ